MWWIARYSWLPCLQLVGILLVVIILNKCITFLMLSELGTTHIKVFYRQYIAEACLKMSCKELIYFISHPSVWVTVCSRMWMMWNKSIKIKYGRMPKVIQNYVVLLTTLDHLLESVSYMLTTCGKTAFEYLKKIVL